MLIPQVPHPTKPIFKKFGIPSAAVARTLGLSYTYLVGVLSGLQTPSPETDAKLRKLACDIQASKEGASR